MLVIYYTNSQNKLLDHFTVSPGKTEDEVHKYVEKFNELHLNDRWAHYVNVEPGSFTEFLLNELQARREFEKECAHRIIEEEPVIVTEILAKLGK